MKVILETMYMRLHYYHSVDNFVGAIISPRLYHPPSNQYFDTNMIY